MADQACEEGLQGKIAVIGVGAAGCAAAQKTAETHREETACLCVDDGRADGFEQDLARVMSRCIGPWPALIVFSHDEATDLELLKRVIDAASQCACTAVISSVPCDTDDDAGLRRACNTAKDLQKQLGPLLVFPADPAESAAETLAGAAGFFIRDIRNWYKDHIAAYDNSDLTDYFKASEGLSVLYRSPLHSGPDRAAKALGALLEDRRLQRLLQFGGGTCKAMMSALSTNGDLTLEEWNEAGEALQKAFAEGDRGPLLMPALCEDESPDGSLRVTLIAGGFEPA